MLLERQRKKKFVCVQVWQLFKIPLTFATTFDYTCLNIGNTGTETAAQNQPVQNQPLPTPPKAWQKPNAFAHMLTFSK